MHGIYLMNEGELRMALVQAQGKGASATVERIERELGRRFEPVILRRHATA